MRQCITNITTSTAVAVLALAAVSAVDAQTLLPFSAYQVIIDRKPFGEVASRTAVRNVAQAEQETQAANQQALARQLDLVAINITLGGTISVGFVDKSEKPPTTHYLQIGESEAGYTVVSADFLEETATILKDGVSVTLKLGSGVVAESATPTGNTAEAKTAETTNARLPIRRRSIRNLGGGMATGGYRGQLERRRNAENEAAAEEEALRHKERENAAAQREHEMNYQLLLDGKEPMSEIHLTKEEEEELVKRGLLSPENEK